MFFAVRLERGGPWDWSRDLREQDGWGEHARFMDSLVDDGFVVLGGPLAGERDILHAVCAPSEEAVRERLAQDNWAQNGDAHDQVDRGLDRPARRPGLVVP